MYEVVEQLSSSLSIIIVVTLGHGIHHFSLSFNLEISQRPVFQTQSITETSELKRINCFAIVEVNILDLRNDPASNGFDQNERH